MKYIKELYEKTYLNNLITSDKSYFVSFDSAFLVDVIVLIPKDLTDISNLPDNFKLLNEDYLSKSDRIINEVPELSNEYYIIKLPVSNEGYGYLFDISSNKLVDNDRLIVNYLIKLLDNKKVS